MHIFSYHQHLNGNNRRTLSPCFIFSEVTPGSQCVKIIHCLALIWSPEIILFFFKKCLCWASKIREGPRSWKEYVVLYLQPTRFHCQRDGRGWSISVFFPLKGTVKKEPLFAELHQEIARIYSFNKKIFFFQNMFTAIYLSDVGDRVSVPPVSRGPGASPPCFVAFLGSV